MTRALEIAAILTVPAGLLLVACLAEADRAEATRKAILYTPVACGLYVTDLRIPREKSLDVLCEAVLGVSDVEGDGMRNEDDGVAVDDAGPLPPTPSPTDAGAVSARDSGDPAPALSVTPGNAVRSVDGGG